MPATSSPVKAPGVRGNGEPALEVDDVQASEADGTMHFTVRPSGAVTRPVTVSYATEDGTATRGEDYHGAVGTLTFGVGLTMAQQIHIRLVNDLIQEDNETLSLRLSDPRGASLPAPVATGTIVDDDRRAVTVAPATLPVREGGAASYTVKLDSQPTGPVTVTPTTASLELSLTPTVLRFTQADWDQPQTVTVAAAQDSDTLADAPAQISHTVEGGGYDRAGASLTVTIVEDDVSTLAVATSQASERAGRMQFVVTLSIASRHIVTVPYATSGDSAVEGQDYIHASGTLHFPASSTAAQTIEVAVVDDALDEPDEHFTVTLSNAAHAVLAGGGTTAAVTGIIEDDDAPPRLTVADADTTTEGAPEGTLRFVVRLDQASGREVTVHYATADGTAHAGSDYRAAQGTLTFEAGTTTQTISIAVLDDSQSEHTETFMVRLSVAVHATLASSGRAATGTIEDDDLPQFSIAGATLTEGSGNGTLDFTVTLNPAARQNVTVDYASADGTAVSGSDYTAAAGTLTFHAGDTTQTISVPVLTDDMEEAPEKLTATLSNPRGATIAYATATGWIIDQGDVPPLTLSDLRVIGGTSMYPAFASDIHHYALVCRASTTLEVRAQALRDNAQLTLLRADPSQNVVGAGTLSTRVTVEPSKDIAIELSDADGTVKYVVHCVWPEFPRIKVVRKSADVSAGLIFITPFPFSAIIDNDGVPRYTGYAHGRDFFRVDDANVVVNGRKAYYLSRLRLLDQSFKIIARIDLGTHLHYATWHDTLITDQGNFALVANSESTRDFSDWLDKDGNPYPEKQPTMDSIIQEQTMAGVVKFEWNSWDHRDVLKVGNDCRVVSFPDRYAYINSVQFVDDDYVVSLRGCAQVLRIDRDTGDVVWKLGGTDPGADVDTEYLEIVDDPAGEFCGQHHPTLTRQGTVVLFDNGVHCLGPRKNQPVFSRVVEYDITSGTSAVMINEFRLPRAQGYAHFHGGVSVLDNGHWLITWGTRSRVQVAADQAVAISEVEPGTGNVLLEMSMSVGSWRVSTYRVHREPEAEIEIPLSLP